MKQTNFYRKMIGVLSVLLLSAGTTYAQTTVTGNVKDIHDEPIIGASVLEIGTTNGTITDFDGNFNLQVSNNATLRISYMGYKAQEVKVSGHAPIRVTLEEDSELLDEVVVVGYGVVKKNDATGSVTAIKPDEMNKGLVTTAQDMLQGKIAGVHVTSDGGTPGGSSTIRIRGGSSLSASNDPLIVIDGLAMDNKGIQGVANPLSMVNPNDIETFTVLKDASATAIYGSRASNGVIIITTKKGALGSKPKFSYEGNASASILTNRLEVMTGKQYTNFISTNFPEYVVNLRTADTDWQNAIYRTALSTDHTFTVSGGTKNMPYRASLGYTYQDGIIKTSNMQRITAALNLSPSFFDKHLTFNVNAKGMYIMNRYADGGAVGSALAFDPTSPIYSDQYKAFGGYHQIYASSSDLGDPSWDALTNPNLIQNPVALLDLKNSSAKSGAFVGNIEADYKIHGLEDLHLHANFGADYSHGSQTTAISPYSYSNNYYGWNGNDVKSKYNLQFNAYAQYYKDFSEKHHFDIMAGYEWQHFHIVEHNEGQGAFRETHPTTPNEPYNVYNHDFATENFLVSFFGRLNYVALNRYMLTATLRGDGSSRFAADKRWGLFPSVALGWKIKEEAFLQDVSWLSDLKLRLSYGITGQQELGEGDYPALVLYTLSQSHASYTLGEIDPTTGEFIYYSTYRPESFNKNLTWEKTTTYNAGLDFGFLRSRITASVDYYFRKTDDLISLVDIPAGTNFKNQMASNIGSLTNQGVEVSFNAKAIDTKKLKWDLGVNFTYNQNKIVSLTTGSDITDPVTGEKIDYYVTTGGISSGTGNTIQRHQEGYAAGTFFVYETTTDEYGSWKIVNQDENVDSHGKDIINEKDLVPYHNAMPDFTIGLQSKWQFYNFDLSFSLRSSIGNYVYNDVKAGRILQLKTPYRDGAFTNALPIAQTAYKYIVNSQNIDPSSNSFMIDKFVENASFLRCDNITLGYTFNKPAIRARIYATVQNPFVISGYTGLDPEVFSGIDNNIYPRSLTSLIGVSLQF